MGRENPAPTLILMAHKPVTVQDQINDHLTRIRLLEEIYVPMAKTAMEIIAGKEGEPGIAEHLRNLTKQLTTFIEKQELEMEETRKIRFNGFERIERLEAWRSENEKEKKEKHEIKLMGMKMSSETKIALVNGMFILLSGIIGFFVSR